MPVIANTYEMIQQIGAGGGGVVYEGRHLRLNKKIALKQDIRGLNADPQVLRQEVDTLKNLNHMYLPQVYDFLQEDGAVYTVMDFIEGESLDKLIERGETVELPQVIEWACELLEALAYLHSRPPYGILHSDIKPANIMITPQKEIRLIDFNIALALGEDNTVRVGRSHGYASPEHYGIDFAASADSDGTTSGRFFKGRKRGASSAANTATDSATRGATSSSYVVTTSDGKTIKLDRRSDIYGVGATLYHLLTGVRPAKADKVNEIEPITHFAINENMAAIVRKAMDPNPDQRYQSAEEMLHALEHIRASDRRSKRHRRHMAEAAALITLLLIAGAAMTFIGQRQIHQLDYYKSCITDSAEALRNGDAKTAISRALDALPENPGLYDPPEYLPEAQLALTNALGTYDLRGSYKAWSVLSLPSEPMKLQMSPDGAKAAALVRDGGTWRVQVFDLESGEKIAQLEAEPSSLSEILFRDNDTLLFAGINGLSACDLTQWSAGQPAIETVAWSTGQPATGFSLPPNGSVIATVYKDEGQAYFYNVTTGEEARPPVSFDGKRMRIPSSDMQGDANFNLFALDSTGRHLAVSFDDGSITVFNLEDESGVSLPPSSYTHFSGCFCGEYFALSCYQEEPPDTRFEIFDTSTPDFPLIFGPLTGSERYKDRYLVQTDGTAFYLSNRVQTVRIDMAAMRSDLIAGIEEAEGTIEGFSFMEGRIILWTGGSQYRIFNEYGQLLEAGETNADNARIDQAVIGGKFLVAANTDETALLVKKLDNHDEALFFTYDPSYYHQEARLREDGEAVCLFSYAGFRIVGRDGALISEMEWDEDATYDPQYRRAGNLNFLGRTVTRDTLEIRYLDGTIEGYAMASDDAAAAGDLLYREQGEAVDSSQSRNVFQTKDYRVISINHGTPEVFDASGEENLKTLDGVTYLKYATQTGDRLILQYTGGNTEQLELGAMLDHNLEKIADMPELSDILPDGTLIFDDGFGNLRRSRIYSIENLIANGKEEVIRK